MRATQTHKHTNMRPCTKTSLVVEPQEAGGNRPEISRLEGTGFENSFKCNSKFGVVDAIGFSVFRTGQMQRQIRSGGRYKVLSSDNNFKCNSTVGVADAIGISLLQSWTSKGKNIFDQRCSFNENNAESACVSGRTEMSERDVYSTNSAE